MAKLPEIRNVQQHGGGVLQLPENEIEESSINDEIEKIKMVKIIRTKEERKVEY